MPCGMGPALSFLKNTKWKEYRDGRHDTVCVFAVYHRATHKNSLTYLSMCPWEKVSTGTYIPDTSNHEIIQGRDDVLHPLVSVVLVLGYNMPNKLTTFAWWYKYPYILQIDAFKAYHTNIWFNPMTLGKTRTTAWKDCWRQERLRTLGKTRTK